jgi:hypothetical protein
MEEIIENQLTDAEVLSGVLPSVLNEVVVRFTFKSNSHHLFATTKPDLIKQPAEPQQDKLGFIWVFDIINQSWVSVDLEDVDSIVDEESLYET